MVNPRDGADTSRNKTHEILTIYLQNMVGFYTLEMDQDKLTVRSGIIGSRIR